jgi:hypothetical protein
MRDVPGFVDTRYRLLQLRSNNRNNWVSFAVAHHLDGNYDMAVNIIRAYESTLVRCSCEQGWLAAVHSSVSGVRCVCDSLTCLLASLLCHNATTGRGAGERGVRAQ